MTLLSCDFFKKPSILQPENCRLPFTEQLKTDVPAAQGASRLLPAGFPIWSVWLALSSFALGARCSWMAPWTPPCNSTPTRRCRPSPIGSRASENGGQPAWPVSCPACFSSSSAGSRPPARSFSSRSPASAPVLSPPCSAPPLAAPAPMRTSPRLLRPLARFALDYRSIPIQLLPFRPHRHARRPGRRRLADQSLGGNLDRDFRRPRRLVAHRPIQPSPFRRCRRQPLGSLACADSPGPVSHPFPPGLLSRRKNVAQLPARTPSRRPATRVS